LEEMNEQLQKSMYHFKAYDEFFESILSLLGGHVALDLFLDIRSDLVKILADQHYNSSIQLKMFEFRLKFLLSKWFNNGLLELLQLSKNSDPRLLANVCFFVLCMLLYYSVSFILVNFMFVSSDLILRFKNWKKYNQLETVRN
jgi:hypothetical protein